MRTACPPASGAAASGRARLAREDHVERSAQLRHVRVDPVGQAQVACAHRAADQVRVGFDHLPDAGGADGVAVADGDAVVDGAHGRCVGAAAFLPGVEP